MANIIASLFQGGGLERHMHAAVAQIVSRLPQVLPRRRAGRREPAGGRRQAKRLRISEPALEERRGEARDEQQDCASLRRQHRGRGVDPEGRVILVIVSVSFSWDKMFKLACCNSPRPLQVVRPAPRLVPPPTPAQRCSGALLDVVHQPALACLRGVGGLVEGD